MKIQHSPWGPIQHLKQLAPGIVSVSTSSHGGLILSEERTDFMIAALPDFHPWARNGFLEEDCDWAVGPLLWPEAFDARSVRSSVQFINGSWGRTEHPELGRYLDGPHGQTCRQIAARWEAENSGKWETGGGMTHGNGWNAELVAELAA